MTTANLNGFLLRLTHGMDIEMLGQESDRQLVERSLGQRDVAALQAIVHRHGAMVYRVCWRVLQHVQDTEDAFQATFLVLAQKLRTLRKHASLASWLHGVAHRISVKARDKAAARHRRESRASSCGTMQPDDVASKELLSILDTELSRLPDKWRLPLVLCYLEGRTQEEAARRLAWSKSTLRSRLEEARDALARRLSERGIALTTALSAVLLSDCVASAAPAPELLARVVEAVAHVAAGKTLATATSATVAALAEGAINAMFITKLKTIAVVLVAAALVGSGIGTVSLPALQARPTNQRDPLVQPKSSLPLVAKDDPATKLVEQLGAPEFADREAAQKRLRELGPKAESAIRVGLRSENPEIALRCDTLLWALRADRLLAPDNPVWLRFKAVAGGDDEARDLYRQMTGARQRGEQLLVAVDDPKAATVIYAKECERLVTAVRDSKKRRSAPLKPGAAPVIDLPTVDLAMILFLGTLAPAVTDGVKGEEDVLEGLLMSAALVGETKRAFGKLYASWTEPRPTRWEAGLFRALVDDIPAMAGVARKTLAAKDDSPWVKFDKRALGLRFLGLYGTTADLSLMMTFSDDKTEFDRVEFSKYPGGVLGGNSAYPRVKNADVVVQARDVAIVAALQLHKQKPRDFGFEQDLVNNSGPWSPAVLTALGFCSGADREAAHKKARSWLIEQQKATEKSGPAKR